MTDFNVQFFPAQPNSKSTYLGGGYIKSGPVSVRFSVFVNDKFNKGFVIALPRKQNNTGEWIDEVAFINKEASEAVYAEVEKQLKSGSSTRPTESSKPAQKAPLRDNATLVERNKPQAGTGAPKELPF